MLDRRKGSVWFVQVGKTWTGWMDLHRLDNLDVRASLGRLGLDKEDRFA